jgi:T5SS/PEP-CTERM-associated repeat protein
MRKNALARMTITHARKKKMKGETTVRKNVTSLLGRVGVALMLVAALQSARAADYYYCGPPASENEGNFHDPANWTPSGGPPGSADVAMFDQDDYFNVYLAQPVITNKLLRVSAGDVSFMMGVPTVGECHDPATYELLGSGTFVRTAAVIGTTPGPQVTLRVHGGFPAHCLPPGYVNAEGMLMIGQTAGSSGRLVFGRAGTETGPVTWTSSYPTLVGSAGAGELDIPATHELINSSATLGVGAGSSGAAEIRGTWTTNGLLQVGDAGSGTLHVWGTVANNGDCYMASEPGSTCHVYLMPSSIYSADWYTQGALCVGGDDAGAGGGAIVVIYAGQFQVGQDTTVWDPGSITVYDGSAQLNDVDIRDGGFIRVNGGTFDSAALNIFPGAAFEANEGTATCTTLNCEGELDVSGGTVTSSAGVVGSPSGGGSALLGGANTSWIMNNNLTVGGANGAHLSVADGATVSNSTAYVAAFAGTTAQTELLGSGTQWNCAGSLYAGGDFLGAGGAGTLDVDNGAELNVGGTMKVWDDFFVEVDGGVINAADLDITGQVTVLASGVLDMSGGTLDVTGGGLLTGAIVGDVWTSVALSGANSNWSMPGSLWIGDGTSGSGHLSSLSLAPGTTVTVDESVTAHNVFALTLAGGTINAAVFDALDASFYDFGTINGDFLTNGSVIPSGDLEVGDINSTTGVQIGGALNVGPHQVTLNRHGLLFVGDTTSMAGGTLSVPGGFGLTPSLDILGFGVVDTPIDPARALVNDGSILGNSADERIELTGYVKGFGTLDNVTITGVDAPGYVGATAVSRGSVDYAGQLVIQIGGLTAGTEYDQINHSGTAGLGGELTIELLDGFEPSLGDSFTILTYGDHTGELDNLSLPPLAGDLQWDVAYGPSSLVLEVVGEQVPCEGDLNGDSVVDLADLAQLLGGYGTASGAAYEDGDLDGDGDVDLGDLAALVAVYGTICE